VWRALLPLVVQLRAPLVTTFAVAHASLFVDLGLNYQNTLSFMPYFVCGYYMPMELLEWIAIRRVRMRLAGGFGICTVALLAFSALGGEWFGVFFARVTLTYACFNGVAPADAPGICCSLTQVAQRAVFYASSLPLLICFVACLPTRSARVWATPGHMSMYVYLLHPLVLFNPWAMKTAFTVFSQMYGREVNVWSPANGGRAVALLIPVALLACIILSTPLTRALCWPLVEPPTAKLFVQSLPVVMSTGSVVAAI